MNLMHEYYRNTLTDREKFFYDGILMNIHNLASKGVVDIYGSFTRQDMSDASAAYMALRIDRPEFYFMDHKIQTMISSHGILRIAQEMRFTQQQISRINRLLKKNISDILEKSGNGNVLNRERSIYRQIINQYQYGLGEYAYDLSGLMVYQSGVCESLSGLLVLALREADIPAIKVHGIAKNGPHCWTMAWINNVPYHLDVTWDLNAKGIFPYFRYFNLTNEEIARDHTIEQDIIRSHTVT